jgi:hypothetical protein
MLPFDRLAEIQEQDGTTLAEDIPVQLDQAGASAVGRGVVYDWTGEAHSDAAPHLIRQTNRRLVVDGVTYKVVEAFQNEFIPHVELRLLEVRGG